MTEKLPALHEIKWIPGAHYATQLDEHYRRLHDAYLELSAECAAVWTALDEAMTLAPHAANGVVLTAAERVSYLAKTARSTEQRMRGLRADHAARGEEFTAFIEHHDKLRRVLVPTEAEAEARKQWPSSSLAKYYDRVQAALKPAPAEAEPRAVVGFWPERVAILERFVMRTAADASVSVHTQAKIADSEMAALGIE